jgi:hypothetical protein
VSEIPIACSLDPDTQKSRGGGDWRKLLAPNLIERFAIPGGARMILRSSPQAIAELRTLIALENSCCAWITWAVEEKTDLLRVDATADRKDGADLLEEWFLSGT